MAPHGVYPTSGEDQWIAISCSSDEQWKQLADELGLESLAAFDLRERLERIDEIEERIAERTSSQNAQDLAESLQRRRVGAHHVQGSLDCFADPQIISRGGLTAPAVHASLGEVPIAVPQYRLSRTVPNVTRAAPTFGEHSLLVLGEFLGYTDERISELVIAGLLD
jgi:crotonobetainyl-CoA:carnitine CoA-transferase CaiB-like acyl-CoA transferase